MSSAHTFVAFVDESGDEGFRFGGGSSDWFALAAAIVRREEELAVVKLVDCVREELNRHRQPRHRIRDKKPLHFRDMGHEQRKFYASCIAQADLRTVCILVNKRDLTSPEAFQQDSRLYFYAVRLLIERVSWYCRDHKRKDDKGDGSVELVFSNKGNMDYEALSIYLDYLDRNRAALDYRAATGVVRTDQVSTYSSGRRMGLQIADAVASSYFFAVERSAYGFTEDGYARLLVPRAYRYQDTLWGYGLKIMPRESEEKRRSGVILPGWDL